MTPVKGKDVIIWVQDNGTYKLLACARSSTLEWAIEAIPTATVDTGRYNTYKTGMADGTISFDFLTTVDEVSRYQFADFVRNKFETHTLKILFTTSNGDILQYEFEAICENISAVNDVRGFSADRVAMRISGETVETIVYDSYPYDESEEEVYSDYWEAAEGDHTVSGASARWSYSLASTGIVTKEPLQVRREGINYEIVSGTPSGRQCAVNTTTGTVTFDSSLPFNDGGERVYVLFKEVPV